MTRAYVLYVDHQGHPAPITECFHATASRLLSSTVEDRFPPSTLTKVDSAYCPQCLSFHDAASAARLGFCPKSTCQRCPICVSVIVSVTVAADNLCLYQCGQCEWTSRECDLTVPIEGPPGKLELTRAAEDLGDELRRRREQGTSNKMLDDYFSQLMGAWEAHSRSSEYQKPSLRVGSFKDPASLCWSVEALEASRESKRNQHYEKITDALEQKDTVDDGFAARRPLLDSDTELPEMNQSMSSLSIKSVLWQALASPNIVERRQQCLPLPIPLRVRRSWRCRAELAQGRPGILLKPKLNPLEGDSSLRSGHGQWWKKDSSKYKVRLFSACLRLLETCQPSPFSFSSTAQVPFTSFHAFGL
jgi:dynactin 4